MRFVRMGAWKSVGPYRLTKCIYDYQGKGYHNISILPSHMFCPNHYRGKLYTANGLVYADHSWANTTKTYHLLSGEDCPSLDFGGAPAAVRDAGAYADITRIIRPEPRLPNEAILTGA